MMETMLEKWPIAYHESGVQREQPKTTCLNLYQQVLCEQQMSPQIEFTPPPKLIYQCSQNLKTRPNSGVLTGKCI